MARWHPYPLCLLILGFNFLKGKDLFEHRKKIYAVFNNVDGLELSNSVSIKGLEVGSVYAIRSTDKSIRWDPGNHQYEKGCEYS